MREDCIVAVTNCLSNVTMIKQSNSDSHLMHFGSKVNETPMSLQHRLQPLCGRVVSRDLSYVKDFRGKKFQNFTREEINNFP